VTETRRPDPCHYDRHHGIRVTKRHRDNCTTNQCDGCKPCTAPHCTICGRDHVDNATPMTCPKCEGKIARDLDDLLAAFTALAREAIAGGGMGRLVAAAPIPGGEAQVLIGPYVKLPLLRTYRGYTPEHLDKDHRPGDPMPPMAVLAQWEDIYRDWLNHPLPDTHWKATVGRSVKYLRNQLPYIAQRSDGPDFLEFTRQLRSLRASCERALHDEREPEEGVECFECGDKLVRRFRRARPCGCGPRPVLRHAEHGPCTCLTGIRIEPDDDPDKPPLVIRLLDRDPYDGHIHRHPGLACIACHRLEAWEAEHAVHDQGGLDDPAAGMSWECPGCRKDYDPGEYQNAVRTNLANSNGGWVSVSIAAQAATAVAGRSVTETTVRGWVGKGWVDSHFSHTPSGLPGIRLVRWADVRREAERTGAGMNQCVHVTPAREWLRVLATYPELEVWAEEQEAGRELCDRCSSRVAATLRQARRMGVA
jgi:hypothetical protein